MASSKHPSTNRKPGHSKVSGGGGESDIHHERHAAGKRGGKASKPSEFDPDAFAEVNRDRDNPRGPDGRPINPQKTDTPGSGQF